KGRPNRGPGEHLIVATRTRATTPSSESESHPPGVRPSRPPRTRSGSGSTPVRGARMPRHARVTRLRRRVLLSVLLVALVLAPTELATSAVAAPVAMQNSESPEQRTAAAFEASRDNPLLLYAFLKAMPKGGDLHNHPSGAEFAEEYIAYAADDGLCVLRE